MTTPAATSSGATGALLGVEHSLAGKCWRERAADQRTALAISQALSVPEIIGRVLAARGVDVAGADAFLTPRLKDLLPDPASLVDMEKAAARLADAIEGGEPIAIFGDYDVDGATAGAVLSRFLAALGAPPILYIPDRLSEGYGPNGPALEKLAGQGARVVVTVDCGINAFEAIGAGNKAGLDIIVCDHHLATPDLPAAFAVVNPNRLDDTSGAGHMAAVGVAFLMAVAVNRQLRGRRYYQPGGVAEPALLELLDMVALGTVCDMVPLVGVNRAFVRQGLAVLGRRRNIGLAALTDVAGSDGPPDAWRLGFILGPRINAGGRVGKSDLGIRLLGTDDPGEAAEIAASLQALNDERREIERRIGEAAIAQVIANDGEAAPLIVAAADDWHAGVIGIVASRLKERFRRPALVIAFDGDTGKGSARSVAGFDFGSAVAAAGQQGLLENGGGHAMAAGLTVGRDKLEALRLFLIERAVAALGQNAPAPRLQIDGVLAPGGVTRDFADLLEAAAPFGQGNPAPRFVVPDLTVGKADVVGKNHVRCFFSGRDGGRVQGIAFRSADSALGRALLDSYGEPLHIAGRLRADDWQGRQRVQLMIEDAAWARKANVDMA